MQPASSRSVAGDFTAGRLTLRRAIYQVRQSAGQFYIAESDLTGKLWEHRVEYTLGSRRMQHYLTTLPGGRIVVLPPTWDMARSAWIHDQDAGNAEEAAGNPFQVWNKSCYSCHASQAQKNFDLQELRYRTSWRDLGVNCERCHGPGAEHIAKAAAAVPGAAARGALRAAIVNPARLDPARSSMVCAQCHSFRDVYADGFQPGANYYDFFLPVMEFRLPASADSAWWPDGRPRNLSNEALALWQSQCFLKGGATCVTCHSLPHDPNIQHNPQLRAGDNTLCARCHAAIGANVASHSHHSVRSPGSSCINCHMPAAASGLRASMRDHSLSVPVPENTLRHGIPNACNLCHQDRGAAWALARLNSWAAGKSRAKLARRADAFTQARRSEAGAIPALLEILADPSGGPWIRAEAVGYLGTFPNDPVAYTAVLRAFADPDPLVRAVAAGAVRPSAAQREALAPQLVSLLRDPARTVQMSAAIALVAMGVQPFPGEDGDRFAHAKQLYRERAELNADDAQQQLAAGRFFLLSGDTDRAISALRAGSKLDPALPVQVLLAQAFTRQGDLAAARQALLSLPRDDPQYAAAQRLLAEIALRERDREPASGGASARPGEDAEARFLNGQAQYRSEYYGAALLEFEQALQVVPDAPWAAEARIDRAVCLEKLGRAREAEAAMQALAGQPEARSNLDLQLAFVELLDETGRAAEAAARLDGVIAASPQAAMAYFWRAKVLWHLHRTSEAAAAAEEAIRLQPQLPDAHNLLVRIYQMLGRTKEAVQQAEWLRDYHRRLESH